MTMVDVSQERVNTLTAEIEATIISLGQKYTFKNTMAYFHMSGEEKKTRRLIREQMESRLYGMMKEREEIRTWIEQQRSV